jgi:dihydroorotate dehydrogenase
MPDWFYRTVSRPLLFRLPARLARDGALNFMGGLARAPFGGAVIDLLGHMRAPQQLQRSVQGLIFPTAVGLAPQLDPEVRALRALARFGFGLLEVGPVTIRPVASPKPIERRVDQQAIWSPEPMANPGLEIIAQRLAKAGPLPAPLMVRIGAPPDATREEETQQANVIIERLAPYAAIFALVAPAQAVASEQWVEHLRAVVEACRRQPGGSRWALLCILADLPEETLDGLLAPALAAGFNGIVIDGSIGDQAGGRLIGRPARSAALKLALCLRARYGSDFVLIASGGVHEPADALALFQAGANIVQTDSGLVYGGPGLPKRINEALLFASSQDAISAGGTSERAVEMTWFWTTLLGVGMLIGSLLALIISATRVVLPYDETFVGLTRAQLAAVHPRLLPFMAHDRVSLAGTMITIGVLYLGLSGGVRRGWHWAQQAILYSAFAGFLSFFLFLGFGYFDPFHAFVAAILFQLFLLALHSRLGALQAWPAPSLREDWRWRWNQWGQLLFVFHGVGLLAAGGAIAAVGVTSVFVPEDLEFMQTTAAAFETVTPRLMPLIAHDRATFGGMLIASGVAVLLPSLWGFRQGERWLWLTFCFAGPPAYLAAIGIHLHVGYINLWHLAPVFVAFALYCCGLALSYPYLCQPRSLDAAQQELFKLEKAA